MIKILNIFLSERAWGLVSDQVFKSISDWVHACTEVEAFMENRR